jgi:hypothetical protein
VIRRLTSSNSSIMRDSISIQPVGICNLSLRDQSDIRPQRFGHDSKAARDLVDCALTLAYPTFP